MKKKTKKILGALGLGLVATATGIAMNLPNPEASATTSVTDTITVRVVSPDASVDITKPKSDNVFTNPIQKIAFDYANITTATIKLYVTDADGEEHEYLINTYTDLDYQAGSIEEEINLDDYGYGTYIIEVVGTSVEALSSPSTISFSYVPFIVSISENDDSSYTESIEYDPSVVDSIEIEVFRETDYKLLWSGTFTDGEKNVIIPYTIREGNK